MRIFEKIEDFISRIPAKYYYIVIPVFLVLSAVSLYSMQHLQIKLSFFDELPEDDPYVKRFKYVSENYGGTDFIFIAIDGENLGELKDCARKVEEKLKSLPYMRSVRGRLDVEFFKNHLLYFLREDDLKELESFMKRREKELKELFQNLKFTDFITTWSKIMEDEILERGEIDKTKEKDFLKSISDMRDWIKEMERGIEGNFDRERYERFMRKVFLGFGGQYEDFSVDEEYITSKDLKTILISAFPSKPADDYGFNKIVYEDIMRIKKEVKCNANFYIGGNYIILEEQRRVALRDMAVTSIISYLSIIFLYFLIFRGFLSNLFMGLFIFIGLILSFGFLMMTFGYVTIISSLFGSFLIGLGIDFGSYIYSRFREEANKKDVKDALKSSVKFELVPMLAGQMTTSLAFLCVAISQIKGAKIISVVASFGVFIYLITAILFLGSLIAVFGKFLKNEKISHVDKIFSALGEFTSKNSRYIIFFFTSIFIIISLLGLKKIGFEYNLRKIFPKLESIKAEDFIVSKFERSKDYTVMLARNITELREKIKKLENSETFGKVESISLFYPENITLKGDYVFAINQVIKSWEGGIIPYEGIFYSSELTSAFQNLLRVSDALLQIAILSGIFKAEDEIKKLKENLLSLIKRIEERDKIDISLLQSHNAEIVRNLLDDLKNSSKSRGFSIEDLPDEIKKQFIGQDNSFIIFAYPKRPIWEDERYMRKNLEEAKKIDKDSFGISAIFLHITDKVKRDFFTSLFLAYIIILISSFITFRKPIPAILSILPVTISMLLTLFTTSILGVKIHYVNMGTYAILLGTGVDYGIHMVHRLLHEHNVKRAISGTGRAIFIAASTTIVGFSSMIFANFTGLRHFGIVLTIGITLSFFLSVILLPSIISLLREKGIKFF